MKVRLGIVGLGLLAACSTHSIEIVRPDSGVPPDNPPVYIPPDAGDANGRIIDPVDAPLGIGPTDGACLSSAESDDARGVLALSNDTTITAAGLEAIGLSTTTANAIAAARPFADLAALDAVPTVGPYACNTLRTNACDVRGLCERELRL
jgi:hypothetical protein